MAIFKTNEERAEIQAQKDLELLKKYGLENLNDPYTVQAIKEMVSGMAGFKWFQSGYAIGLQGEKAVDLQMKKTLIDQNFILIRQLDEINRKLNNV